MIRDKILALKSMQPFTVKNDDVVDIVDLDTDDEETIDTDEEINDNTNEETIDTDEEIAYINMLNKMISKANEFSLVRNMYAQNTKEISEIFIEIEEGIIYEDPSQPTFQRRINVVLTLWINVEITLIRR